VPLRVLARARVCVCARVCVYVHLHVCIHSLPAHCLGVACACARVVVHLSNLPALVRAPRDRCMALCEQLVGVRAPADKYTAGIARPFTLTAAATLPLQGQFAALVASTAFVSAKFLLCLYCCSESAPSLCHTLFNQAIVAARRGCTAWTGACTAGCSFAIHNTTRWLKLCWRRCQA
jgi:hypothetical protein